MNSIAEGKKRRLGPSNELMAGAVAGVLLCLVANQCQGQTHTNLHNFTGDSAGANPAGPLLLSGNTLYGTTTAGGSAGYGTVFRMNTDGSGYAVLHSFTIADGAGPRGTLGLSGTTLYGITMETGTCFGGTIFKVNEDGSGFAVLKRYTDGNDGAAPIGGLVVSGTNIYGTTSRTSLSGCGAAGGGMVFKLNTDGSGYTVLKTFSGTDAANPATELLLSGTTLYGTTAGADTAGHCGTVFKINTDGSDFTILQSFNCSDGGSPMSGLVLAGTVLYGTTWGGGSNFAGTVFKVNTDGSGFAVLKNFTGSDGTSPEGSLVLSGTTLFGTAANGGHGYTIYMPSSGDGMVYSLNTDGSDYSVLLSFNGTNGTFPLGGVCLAGTTLFGTTSHGVSSTYYGTVFSLALRPPILSKPPQSQTAEVGSQIGFTATADASPPATWSWLFNGSVAGGGAANPSLRLTNVGFAQAGAYAAIAANCFGVVTSAPAMLNVIPSVPRRPVPGVKVMGQSGSVLKVDYANTLQPTPAWNTFGSVSLNSPAQFCFDVTTPLPAQRFYRAWQTNTPAEVSTVSLIIVPAITLTGNIGDSWRLDCINAIGPTDAWMNLDTVTLTNTSQLYFDLSAPTQARRLYRIVPAP